MAYYQDIVIEYLRAHRSVFVNTECLIQLKQAHNPDASGPHWYCDVLAVDLKRETAYLCEVSYAKTLGSLLKRLQGWKSHWPELREGLARDCNIDNKWQVRPWLFVPNHCIPVAIAGMKRRGLDQTQPEGMPVPAVTDLESVVPWKYCGWNGRPAANGNTHHPIPADLKLEI